MYRTSAVSELQPDLHCAQRNKMYCVHFVNKFTFRFFLKQKVYMTHSNKDIDAYLSFISVLNITLPGEAKVVQHFEKSFLLIRVLK